MKGFGRLFDESRRFYLYVLAIIAVFVLADCILICNDYRDSLTKSGMEKMVQKTLMEENGTVILENRYLSMENVVNDKGAQFGLSVVMLGIMALLFAREIVFSDVRTQEFRCTWPFKKWVRELYDYVAMLVAIVFGVLLQMAILLFVQNRYNNLLIEVLSEQGITSKVTDMMSASNLHSLTSMTCYLIAIVVSYTWISLGMSLAKNSIVGGFLSVVVKLFLQLVWSQFGWSVIALMTSDWKAMQSIYYTNDLANTIIDIGDLVLIYQEFFLAVDVGSGTISGYVESFTIAHWMVAQVVIWLLLVIGLIISANKKDLANGKLLYFPVLGYPLGVLVGLGVFLICCDWLWWDDPGIVSLVALILGFLASIGTCLLCQSFSKSKSLRLEVK